ncbi:hypothetical protein APED_18730 [Acanthopleuribacter pedis]
MGVSRWCIAWDSLFLRISRWFEDRRFRLPAFLDLDAPRMMPLLRWSGKSIHPRRNSQHQAGAPNRTVAIHPRRNSHRQAGTPNRPSSNHPSILRNNEYQANFYWNKQCTATIHSSLNNEYQAQSDPPTSPSRPQDPSFPRVKREKNCLTESKRDGFSACTCSASASAASCAVSASSTGIQAASATL